MDWKAFKRRETFVWHHRFMPSLIAGAAVSFLTLFFEFTAPNVVMFASLGASAVILTHKFVHKLSVLRTVLVSYLCSLIISLILLWFVTFTPVPFSVIALLAVTGTTFTLYLVDAFHPPAVAASLAFILYEGSVGETFAIWISVVFLLIVIKVLTYVFYYEHLTLKEFFVEFKQWEEIEWDEIEHKVGGKVVDREHRLDRKELKKSSRRKKK